MVSIRDRRFHEFSRVIRKTFNTSIGLSELSLRMNSQKSSYIVFKKKPSAVVSESIDLNGYCLKRVEEIKYLGVILASNATIAKDVDRCCSAFLRQFNAIYRKFKFMDMNIMRFLFVSSCGSFYGIETWYSKLCSFIDVSWAVRFIAYCANFYNI